MKEILELLDTLITIDGSYQETITPEIAKEMLEANTHNRSLSEAHLARLIDDLKNGNWQFNGESIKFDANGNLLDGQHRLTAIARTGIPADMLVITGLPNKAQTVMDTGKKRTLGNMLQLDGYSDANALAAYLNHKALLQKHSLESICSTKNRLVTTSEGLKQNTEETRREFKQISSVYRRAKSKGVFIPSVVKNGVFQILIKYKDDFDYFTQKLIDGTSTQLNDPIIQLRNIYIVARSKNLNESRNYTEKALAALTIKAWNLFITGESCNKLKYIQGGAKREKFPTIITPEE